MNLSQALTMSAQGMDAQTDRLRAIAADLSLRGGMMPAREAGARGAEWEWPHSTNMREIQASRSRLTRLIAVLG